MKVTAQEHFPLDAGHTALLAENERLLALLKRAEEELRLIRMKDCLAVYDTTIRLEMRSALSAKG